MYVQTKKVVIIYIVTIITFASVINGLYRETQSSIPQISVVSSEELSYKISFAQSLFNDLSVDGDNTSELARYGASIYQIAQSSSAQLTNIVNSSGTIIVIGDTFNKYLGDLIVENEDRQFVLVENSSNYKYDNVYQINIDYKSVFDSINRMSLHQKSVVVITNEFSSLAESVYYESAIATNGNIKLEIVEDTTDIVSLKSALNKDLQNGFTKVYSFNPYNNSTIIEVINKYNQDIDAANAAASQQSEETDSNASDQETAADDVVVSQEYASLAYLTLSQNDYLSQTDNANLSKYVYDASKQMKEIINSTMNEQLSHSDELISITNNK